MKYEGIVFKVYEKNFGKGPTFSIKLDGQPLYHRAGSNRYAGIAESGNRVTFEADMNPDQKSTTIKGPVTLAAPPAPVAAAPSAGPAFGQDRNNSIVYQSSLKAALAFVSAALAAGAIKLPAKESARLQVLETAVDHYTAQFFEDVGTLGAVVRENEGAGSEAPAAAETDAEDE